MISWRCNTDLKHRSQFAPELAKLMIHAVNVGKHEITLLCCGGALMNLPVVIFFHRLQLKPMVMLVLMLPPSVQKLLFNRYSFYPIEICGFINIKITLH